MWIRIATPASAEPTQQQALAFAERIARRYFLSARALRRAVTEVESRIEELVRVLLFVERVPDRPRAVGSL